MSGGSLNFLASTMCDSLFGYKIKNNGSIQLDISNIIQCSNMLHNIKILNLDFKDVIQKYDSNMYVVPAYE